jgi:hypothetical protein
VERALCQTTPWSEASENFAQKHTECICRGKNCARGAHDTLAMNPSELPITQRERYSRRRAIFLFHARFRWCCVGVGQCVCGLHGARHCECDTAQNTPLMPLTSSYLFSKPPQPHPSSHAQHTSQYVAAMVWMHAAPRDSLARMKSAAVATAGVASTMEWSEFLREQNENGHATMHASLSASLPHCAS